MINLIKNEIIKIGILKQLLTIILFIAVLITMHTFDIDTESKLLDFIPYIGLSTIILYGGVMSNEYQTGTIKFYLTKPHKRSKILLSKLSTIIFYTLFLLIVVLIICIVINNGVNHVLIKDYFYYSIPLILICVLTLFLSTIFKSSSLVTSILLLLEFTSTLITELFLTIKINIVEYTFLPYLDFNIYKNIELINSFNEMYNINLNLVSGVLIIIFYSIILFLLTIYIFNKKDIKS